MKTKFSYNFDNKDGHIVLIWAQLVSRLLFLLMFILLFAFAPKKVFAKEFPYKLATSAVKLDDDNFMLFENYPAISEYSYNRDKEKTIHEIVLSFKEKNNIVAVRVYGANYKIEIKDDYIYIESPDVEALNIEAHYIYNIVLAGYAIPPKTLIILLKDLTKLINSIYLFIILVVFASLVLTFSYKLIKSILKVKKGKVV